MLPEQGGPGHVPHLAKDWTIDGTAYTFTLRDDAAFASGNPLRAEDVVYSLERMQALGVGAVLPVRRRHSGRRPRASMSCGSRSLSPTPRSSPRSCGCRSSTRRWWRRAPSRSGERTSCRARRRGNRGLHGGLSQPAQAETVMAKNDDYFLDVPAAAPDIVRLRYGLEAATVRTLISRGEHDIASQWLPPEVVKALADDGAQLLTESGTGRVLPQDEHAQAPARRPALPSGARERVRLRTPPSRWSR